MGFFKKVLAKSGLKSAEGIINDLSTEEFYKIVLSASIDRDATRESLHISDRYEFTKAFEKRLRKENLRLIESTSDQEILKQLALSDPGPLFSASRYKSDDEVRIAAIRKIDDEEFLVSLLSKQMAEVNSAIIDNVSDNSLLFDVATNDKYAKKKTNYYYYLPVSLRIRAVEKITDDDLLSEITLKSDEIKISAAAAKKIQNKDLVMNLLLNNDFSADVKKSLVSNLDEAQLREIIDNPKDLRIWEMALIELGDSDFTGNYAEKGSEDLRKIAVKHTDDQKLLEKIVRSDKSKDVRLNAVEYSITDNGILKGLLLAEKDEDVQRKIIFKISDDYVLEDLALNCDDSYIAHTCLQRITDSAILKRLNNELPYKHCPKCGSYNVHYTDFYDESIDLFCYGDYCYNCNYKYNKTPK